MTPFAQATPSQIAAARAHTARLARWAETVPLPTQKPVRVPLRPQEPAPEPVEAKAPETVPAEVWPPYPEPVPYDSWVEVPRIRSLRPGKAIVLEVAEKHGVSLAEITSSRRFKNIVAARQEAYYRLIEETDMSFPQVGRLLGGKDSTTVLYGLRKHASVHGLSHIYGNKRPTHRRGLRTSSTE